MWDRDPGAGGNWIDSFSHTHGVFTLRLIKTRAAPSLTLRQVSVKDLEERGFACLDHVEPQVSGSVVE